MLISNSITGVLYSPDKTNTDDIGYMALTTSFEAKKIPIKEYISAIIRAIQ